MTETEETVLDLEALRRWFDQIPAGPFDALHTTTGWEVRQLDTDPTNKHHWPFRLCSSVAGQTAGCDEAVFSFIAGVINAWPAIDAALSRAPEVGREVPSEIGQFVGDIFFGDPTNSIRGTHRWTGTEWVPLPTDVEVLVEMLADARAQIAALSPPSTGEAVAWRCLNVHGDAFLTEDANGAHFWLKSGKPVQPLYLHPSPEMGEISREEIEQLAEDAFNEGWRDREVRPSPMINSRANMRTAWLDSNARDAILSKLKENGLSREGLGGSARARRGAAGPWDCAEGDARLSDGGGG